MLEISSAIVIAVLVAGVFYWFLEWREIFSVKNRGGIVSGAETAVGSDAKVIAAFAKTTGHRKPEGRIRIEGESWRAVLDGDAANLPAVGDRVTVLDMDAARLVARVQERLPASKDS
ncbi:MAG: NfeD family protein [Pseudomonadota bacterium]